MIPEEIIVKHFPFLSEKGLKTDFSGNSKYSAVPAGTILLKEGDNIHYLPLIIKGNLKVTRSDRQGRDVLLYYISQGESCIASYAAALSRDLSRINAVAEDDCEVVLVPVNLMDKWAQEYPSWNSFIIRLFYKRFEELLSSYNAMAYQKLDERLKEHLRLKQKMASSDEIMITHQQLADELSTAREVVSRLLKTWESDGKVVLSRGMIKINPSL
jgi:CRP/FNR family transcriptional regulator